MPVIRIGEALSGSTTRGAASRSCCCTASRPRGFLWKRVAPLLVEAGFVIAPDLVGYGESSCPRIVEPDSASMPRGRERTLVAKPFGEVLVMGGHCSSG